MTQECPDGTCKLKIRAIDRALGHEKNEWAVLLNYSEVQEDINNALRFCEAFHLEPKVQANKNGYTVFFRFDGQNNRLHQ